MGHRLTVFCALLVVAFVGALPVSHAVEASKKPPLIPTTPKDFPQCEQSLVPPVDLPRSAGERISYLVDVDGISMGTVDFSVERNGYVKGQEITEYRSFFRLDSVVSVVIPVEGRAASLVPDATHIPMQAMSRFVSKDKHYDEDLQFKDSGRMVISRYSRNGNVKAKERALTPSAQDFVSGFFSLRSYPRDVKGCVVLYANQKGYTIWIEPLGEERIKTPVGMRQTDKYSVRYVSERSTKPYDATVWMSQGRERLPYRAELRTKYTLVARIHMYEAGHPR